MNNNGESSNGRIGGFEPSDVGSSPASPSIKRKRSMSEYQKKWYQRNKKKVMEQTNRNKKEIKRWFYEEIVSKCKCECGESHPATIDFHHLDPSIKTKEVSKMVYDNCSKESILKEIKKCKVLCSNCHRKLHWEERQ